MFWGASIFEGEFLWPKRSMRVILKLLPVLPCNAVTVYICLNIAREEKHLRHVCE